MENWCDCRSKKKEKIKRQQQKIGNVRVRKKPSQFSTQRADETLQSHPLTQAENPNWFWWKRQMTPPFMPLLFLLRTFPMFYAGGATLHQVKLLKKNTESRNRKLEYEYGPMWPCGKSYGLSSDFIISFFFYWFLRVCLLSEELPFWLMAANCS